MTQTLLDQVAALEARAQGDYVDDRINADVRQLCAKLRECVVDMKRLILRAKEFQRYAQNFAEDDTTDSDLTIALKLAEDALAPWPEAG